MNILMDGRTVPKIRTGPDIATWSGIWSGLEPRSGFSDRILDHVPDREKSSPKSGPRTGPNKNPDHGPDQSVPTVRTSINMYFSSLIGKFLGHEPISATVFWSISEFRSMTQANI